MWLCVTTPESSTLCQILPLKRVTTVYYSALRQPALVATPKRRCLHHRLHFVFSVRKKIINSEQSEQWQSHCIDLPHHWVGCQIASAPSAVCHYRALSVHCLPWVKVYFFSVTVVAFVEDCWVPSGEGSGLWFSPAKCSASLPSKPDLETCLLSTHGESSLKFHATWTSV